MEKFNFGDKVRCVKLEHTSPSNCTRVKIGEVYTVHDIREHHSGCMPLPQDRIHLAEVEAKDATPEHWGFFFHEDDFELVGRNDPMAAWDRAMGVV